MIAPAELFLSPTIWLSDIMSNKRTIRAVYQALEEFLIEWEKGENPELGWFTEDPQVKSIGADLLKQYFRYRGFILAILDQLCQKQPKPELARLLQLGVGQLIFHGGIRPEHLVNALVDRVKRGKQARAAGFVNGVLRNFMRQFPKLQAHDNEQPVEARLRETFGTKFNRLLLGTQLYDYWMKLYGAEAVNERCEELTVQAPLTVRQRRESDLILPVEVLRPIELPEWAGDQRFFVCEDPQALFGLSDFNHHFYVQDLSTLMAPAMFSIKPDGTYGDFCAAPGGKSLIIAEQLQKPGVLFCGDINPGRLKRLEENLHSCDCVNIRTIDACKPVFPPETFDGILLDVPCSNTGVIRRRPDVRWRFSTEVIQALQIIQMQMVRKAVGLLKKGGELVYSTCSIDEHENSRQVELILKEFPELKLICQKQLLPSEVADGAFAATLQKI